MTVINLVSGPRNISTALMYSFAQRSDTVVADEPYYAVYLIRTGLQHPGREKVIESLPNDEEGVNATLQRIATKPVLFIKNMAHHMEVLRNPLIPGAVNVFLIRDPLYIIASYSKVIDKPTLRDIGLSYQYTMLKHQIEAGIDPIVVDSAEVVADPEAVLSQLCARCGLSFEQRMLHWPPGPKSYDGIWARYWYENVHKSSGFDRITHRNATVPEGLEQLYEQARYIYEKLLPFSLKA